MIFGDLVGLKLPDIFLTGEKKPLMNLSQETCPGPGSNPGTVRDKRACYFLLHNSGPKYQYSIGLLVSEILNLLILIFKMFHLH